MKIFFDFFPLALFFLVWKLAPSKEPIYPATAVLIGATAVQVLGLWVVKRKVEKMYLFIFAAVLVLGGLTLVLHNDRFLKLKPTVVNAVMGLVFLGSAYIGEKPLVRRMMEKALHLPDRLWKRLNLAWVGFFFVSAAANQVVAETCSQAVWVNFKVFGLLGMSFVFIFGQIFLLRRYLVDPEAAGKAGDAKPDVSAPLPDVNKT